MFKKYNRIIPYLLTGLMFIWHSVLYAQQQMRYPRPEFETDYTYPTYQYISQRSPVWEYIDVAVLIAALSLTSWLVLKKRSRQGIVWVSLFSLAYFGFFRQGCICAVGSVQNVSLALFNSDYSMPLTALLFFLIPLGFALFSGRVFCAGVCPLGAIQELTGFRQVKVNPKIEAVLGSVPFVYLGLAVLFSATGSQFIICRYDPFVGIFRLGAPYIMVIFGVLLLVTGIFVNRPYCRYLCPYGVLQNIFSRFSYRHLSITPAECINCRRCEPSCPYGAINVSDKDAVDEAVVKPSAGRFLYPAIIAVIAASFALIAYNAAPLLAGVNKDVMLAKEIRLEKEKGIKAVSEAAVAFRESSTSEEALFAEEINVIKRFRAGAPWVGIFLGLSLGLGFYRRMTRLPRTEYEPDRGRCVSCGKCFRYCPVKPN